MIPTECVRTSARKSVQYELPFGNTQLRTASRCRANHVLKMCQHQNIIKLLDLFESSEHYYIVLEYMQGKDLFDYIAKRDYKLQEERAKQIIY